MIAVMKQSQAVSAETMAGVYEAVKTPHKHGVVLRGEPGDLVDCANVFRMDGTWWMVYVCHRRGIGYETMLARSDDLLAWETVGVILPFAGESREAAKPQAAGGPIDLPASAEGVSA
jgi:hypothetical protein